MTAVYACEDCAGKGWDVYNEDENGLGDLQRCDTCQVFASDEEALAAALGSGAVMLRVKEVEEDK